MQKLNGTLLNRGRHSAFILPYRSVGRYRHDVCLNHPVDLFGDTRRHGTGFVAQLRDSLGGIKFVVAHEVIHGKARHASFDQLRYAAILEARKLMAEAEAGKKHTKTVCPHCGKKESTPEMI